MDHLGVHGFADPRIGRCSEREAGDLTLAARIAGDDVAKTIQLGIEYDPQPPFDSGSVDKAGPEIAALAAGIF